jgi:hypothetical protein
VLKATLYKIDLLSSILFILSINEIASSETIQVLPKTKLPIELECSLLFVLTGTIPPACDIFVDDFRIFGANLLFKRVPLISNVFFHNSLSTVSPVR